MCAIDLSRDVGKSMDLSEAYEMLSALSEPAAVLEGRYGTLSGEQRTYAQMIDEGNRKARQWIDTWLKHDRQAVNADLLAVHAHKINSGLTMMIGYASLMLTGLGGSVNADLAAALNAIVTAGEQVHMAVQRTFDAYADEIPGE